MRAISEADAQKWCQSHGVPLGEFGLPSFNGKGTEQFSIPIDAGERTALAKQQMMNLADGDPLLVWLDNWSVWPSGQWHHLFDRFRLSYGCPEPLIEKPAFLIEKTEFDAAISIAVYAILMLWDCYLIADADSWLYYSHDECGGMKTRN
jgi:hypothetical protein